MEKTRSRRLEDEAEEEFDDVEGIKSELDRIEEDDNNGKVGESTSKDVSNNKVREDQIGGSEVKNNKGSIRLFLNVIRMKCLCRKGENDGNDSEKASSSNNNPSHKIPFFSHLHISSSKIFALQAVLIWAFLCLPGNIATLYMYHNLPPVPQESGSPSNVTGSTAAVLPPGNESRLDLSEERDSLKLHRRFAETFCRRMSSACQVQPEKTAVCETAVLDSIEKKVNNASLSDLLLKTSQPPSKWISRALEEVGASVRDSLRQIYPESCFPQQQPLNQSDLECYEKRDVYSPLAKAFYYWVEGVGVVIAGTLGVFGNILTILTLRKMRTNKNFNNLLIGLSVFDTFLIVVVMIEQIIMVFLDSEPLWYRYLYPKVFHPLRGIVQTSVIYVLMAVSTERFKAVCHPLAHRQAYYKFIVVAFTCSFSLELPRFFEFELKKQTLESASGENLTEVDYYPTQLMEDADYIRLNSYWNELLATGALPLIALCYMNFRIYLKIRASSKFTKRFVASAKNNSGSARDMMKMRTFRSHATTNNVTIEGGGGNGGNGVYSDDDEETASTINSSQHRRRTAAAAAVAAAATTPLGLRKTRFVSDEISVEITTTHADPSSSGNGNHHHHRNSASQIHAPLRGSVSPRITRGESATGGESAAAKFSKEARKGREKSTIILVAIVLTFIICHTYRLSLRIYEIANPENNTLDHFRHCRRLGRYHVPFAFYILVNFHHLFIVINSSVNIIIYCCVGKEFRRQALHICKSCFTK